MFLHLVFATKDISNWRSNSLVGDNYVALAAFTGVSVLAAAITVNMFTYSDGDMMKTLLSPLGFDRTAKSNDVASNIPNLGKYII